MVRTLDRSVDDAIAAAALTLLVEQGFARLTIEAVAKAAVFQSSLPGNFLRRIERLSHQPPLTEAKGTGIAGQPVEQVVAVEA